jgi:hypothetical protein
MKRRIMIATALLFAATTISSAGDNRFYGRDDGGWHGHRYSGGYNHTISRHSLGARYWDYLGYGYNVPGCKGWPCLSNNATVLTVPQDMNFNTNPNWGKGCRSCFDASK